jgi:hypothetical protein
MTTTKAPGSSRPTQLGLTEIGDVSMNIRKPRFTRTWKCSGFTIRVLALYYYDNDFFTPRDIYESLLLATIAGMRRFTGRDATTTRSLFPKPDIEVQVSVEPGLYWEEAATAARLELVRLARRWRRKLERLLSTPVDWEKIGDEVCQVLVHTYRQYRNYLETMLAELGCTLEKFTASAITQTLRKIIERRLGGTTVDWEKFGDAVCQVLVLVYGDFLTDFETEAARRGGTVEQLTAAAITQMVREMIEGRLARESKPEEWELWDGKIVELEVYDVREVTQEETPDVDHTQGRLDS